MLAYGMRYGIIADIASESRPFSHFMQEVLIPSHITTLDLATASKTE